MDLTKLTIQEVHKKLKNKEISCVELTQAFLDNIKKKDDKIKAFITVTEKEALAQAEEIDIKINNGEEIKPLAGIPVAIKDIFCTDGIKTTAASNILANYIPPYDATVVRKLKDQGAVILGKTNLDAFAHGSSTETSDFFTTRNPYDIERIPGGSSGGSAAAVASDECIYALGTETGGSIRQPAALCGVVGLKPTYGRVSRYGLTAMSSSLDCPGPITKTVKDAAIVLNAISGMDKKDSTSSVKLETDFGKSVEKYIKDIKIGIPKEYFPENLQPQVKEEIENAINKLEKLGAEIKEISLPYTKYGSPCYAIICTSEVSANLSRYDGVKYGYSVAADKSKEYEVKTLLDVYKKSRKYGFGDEAKRRIMTGTYSLSSGYYDKYYLKASKVRRLILEDFRKAFKEVDVIVGPSSPNLALRIGEAKDNPIFGYISDILINPSSLAGLPGISVPCGFAKPDDGNKELPVGLQIIGKQFDEESILRVAYTFEKAAGIDKNY